MKSNRRNFLKTTAAAGAGALAGGIISGCKSKEPVSNMPEVIEAVRKSHVKTFNMSGYAAPLYQWYVLVLLVLEAEGPALFSASYRRT